MGVFKLAGPEDVQLDSLDKDQREDQQAFVTLETEVLLHHVAETLLRLYLAHENSPPCPWIAVSRERSPRRFKRKIQNLLERLNTSAGKDAMASVLFGTADRTTFGTKAPSEDQWNGLVNSSADWLAWFGRYILDGDVYNAAKHGLGVSPQNIGLKIEIDGLEFLNGSGPCLEYLHSVPSEEGKQWKRTTKWLQCDRLFGCIHIACQLIHRLWTVGSVHYGSKESLELELRAFVSPSELFKNEEMALTKFSKSLGFNADGLDQVARHRW